MFASSHSVVLPSINEELPKVLMEAAACAGPVVTDVPGCRDAIEPEKTVLVAPARDSVALAKTIARLVLGSDFRHSRAMQEERWRSVSLLLIVNMRMDVYQALE